MELRQLRYFCAVAEELSFARASRRLFIAQPALSIQIRNLESELKVKLLRRTTRLVEITHAGETFYAEARAILDRVDAAGQHAQDAERGVIGTLRVAFFSNIATARLGASMRLYHERFPKVNLVLMEAATHRQIEFLVRGDLDVGLLRVTRERTPRSSTAAKVDTQAGSFALGANFPSDELDTMQVACQPLIVAVPTESALAMKKRLTWRDLHNQPMINTNDPRDRGFDAFFACCERARVRPVVRQYAHDLATRLWMVACGFGFSPTAASSQEISRPGLSYRPLPKDGPEVLTFAAWRRTHRAPHLLQFVETLKQAAKKSRSLITSGYQ